MIKLILGILWMLSQSEGTDRPIIGVLSQELSNAVHKHYPKYTSYIVAAYVKSLEGSGARVVPILIGKSQDYYRKMAKSINGFLLPGGYAYLDKKDGYVSAASVMYESAIEMNRMGINYPIIGVCLGFQLYFYFDTQKDIRVNSSSMSVLRLNFREDYRESRLFRHAPAKVLQILENEPIAINHHLFGITERAIAENGLSEKWRVLSENEDDEGDVTFVSTVESTRYPFVGLQYHPEKNLYEWRHDLSNPHSPNAIYAARFFFDWLVSEARRNNNSFQDLEEEQAALIYNYDPIYTRGKLIFDQIYLFNDEQ